MITRTSNSPLRRWIAILGRAATFPLLLLSARAWGTTYTVNSSADPGDGVCDGIECTLREAINAANASPGLDVIEFAIGGGGAQTISLQSPLPLINQSIVIDGTTQPLFIAAPLITIDAAGVGTGFHLDNAANSVIRAVTIENAENAGIQLQGVNDSSIQDVTTSWSGSSPKGTGVSLYQCARNTIERVTALNREIGISIFFAESTLILNNRLSGAVMGISAGGHGNKFFNNDLSYATTFPLSIAQDNQFEIAGNNLSHSANGLNLYAIDGLVASPNPGPGQLSMDVSTIPGVGLTLTSVSNSRFSGLDLSWGGSNLSSKGVFLNGGAGNTLMNIVAKQRQQGVVAQGSHGNHFSDLDLTWTGTGKKGEGVNLYQCSLNTIERVTSLNREIGISIFFAESTLIQDNHLSGAVTGISAGGRGNKFLGNDLSFASTFPLSVVQDNQFQIAENNLSQSANGLYLYSIDGLVASPDPRPGQISMDVSTIPGVGLTLSGVHHSQFSGLDLSWGGTDLTSQGVFLDGSSDNTLKDIVARQRQNGVAAQSSHRNRFSDLDLTWIGTGKKGEGVNLYQCSLNTIERVTSLNREIGIHIFFADSTLIQDNHLSGAVTGISAGGQGNKFFGNDLSFASTFPLSIVQDTQFQIAGNNLSHSANGLNLYAIDGLVASPDPGPGQISIDVSTIPGVGLSLSSVRNSRINGLVLSWNGENLAGWNVPPSANGGLFVQGSDNNLVSTITAGQREVGIAISGNDVVVECSLIQNNRVGVLVNTGSGIILRDCVIAENSSAGLLSFTSSLVTAENNFWGTSSGPGPAGSNNPIVGNIDADPFSSSLSACMRAGDREPPVLSCPPAMTVPFGSLPPPAITAAGFFAQGGSLTDNRDSNPSVTSLDSISGYCPMWVTRTYTVSDASGNSATCDQIITVNNLFAADGIIWHQPLARNGGNEDTDPSAGGSLKYGFKLGSTIPIKIHAQACGGTAIAVTANVMGKVQVFADTDCDGVPDGHALLIDYNGVGGASGVMDKDGEHLKFNLDTKTLPKTAQCYILQVTVTDSSTGESRSETLPLHAK